MAIFLGRGRSVPRLARSARVPPPEPWAAVGADDAELVRLATLGTKTVERARWEALAILHRICR